MEWSEDTILRYIQEGWTLSWDKTNRRFKLQKRINGKVKSYTLPKEFNEFCKIVKSQVDLKKIIEDFREELRKYKKEFEYVCPYCFRKVKSSYIGVFRLVGVFKSLEEKSKITNKIRELGLPSFGVIEPCPNCYNLVHLVFIGFDFMLNPIK